MVASRTILVAETVPDCFCYDVSACLMRIWQQSNLVRCLCSGLRLLLTRIFKGFKQRVCVRNAASAFRLRVEFVNVASLLSRFSSQLDLLRAQLPLSRASLVISILTCSVFSLHDVPPRKEPGARCALAWPTLRREYIAKHLLANHKQNGFEVAFSLLMGFHFLNQHQILPLNFINCLSQFLYHTFHVFYSFF